MIDVILLAIALSMDSFAVSIGLGAKNVELKYSLGILAGVYFGLFQGLMPLLGFLGGASVFAWIDSIAHWIAFLLLSFVGVKMIYESQTENSIDNIDKVTHRVMLMLALATSIDALAAGFSLTLLELNPYYACFIIGTITFFFSWLGVLVGAKTGTWLESKAELIGGLILILIGFKILLM